MATVSLSGNFRSISKTYDQDFEFVDSYVKFSNGIATLDELESLKSGYISALYKYKSKLETFLKTVELKQFPQSHTKKFVDRPNSNLNNFYTEIAEEFDRRIKYIKDSSEGFSDEINIEVQKLFMLMVGAFCLDFSIINRVRESSEDDGDEDIPVAFGSKYCFLLNDTGFFGLNTWLYAYFMNVSLIGIPSRYSNYVSDQVICPSQFIFRDYDRDELLQFTRKENPEMQISLYKQIITDTEATMEQKELLLLVLWVILHETDGNIGVFPDFFKDDMTTPFIRVISLFVDMYDEFIKFRDLIVTQEMLDLYFYNLDKYKGELPFKYLYNIPRDIKDYKLILDRTEGYTENKSLYSKIKQYNPTTVKIGLMWPLIVLYFRNYCLNYYTLEV